LAKKTVFCILSWGAAFALALLCANLLSFFYRSGAGSIQRENAYSRSIRTPNSWIVRGAEGYGINAVDENGYLNDSGQPLKADYILLMGSSHAEGLQVMQEDTMTGALNRMLDPEARTVYNLGTAGHTLPLIVEGFPAAIAEFPDAAAVMIEITRMDFTSDELLSALEQPLFDEASAGASLARSLSAARRIRNDTLGALPIISLLRQQFESMEIGFAGAFGIAGFSRASAAEAGGESAPEAGGESAPEASRDADGREDAANAETSYYEALHQALASLRAVYQKPIIVLYHERVLIRRDGSSAIERETRCYDDFRAACSDNDIVFVDAGDAFLNAYETDYTIPYGFFNTTLGGGHLNRKGHQIVAEAFYRAWMEVQEKGKN
jgi:hypothetical protein